MNKQELTEKLRQTYANFSEYVLSLSEEQFIHQPSPEKWTSGQQAEHIFRSIRPVNMALFLPDWFLKWYIGKANRPSRSYDELVERYNQKLGSGGRAPGPFMPKTVPFSGRKQLAKKINGTIGAICKKLSSYSEERLDLLILPHPLLGKITLREMIYFTIYHCLHHQESIQENLTTNSTT